MWFQVYESEQEYHVELSRLNDELGRCNLEASQHEAVLNSVRLSSDEKISQLQEDKAILQVCVSYSELHWLDFLVYTVQSAQLSWLGYIKKPMGILSSFLNITHLKPSVQIFLSSLCCED